MNSLNPDSIEKHFSGNYTPFYKHYIPNLKRVGAGEHQALCPFHADKTPSLSIEDESGLFFCHGCGAKGNPVAFYARLNGLDTKADFPKIVAGICRAFGINGQSEAKKIIATYDYHDESGNLLYQEVRFEPKDFRLRRPDGNGGYIWNLQGVETVLYNLPAVIPADDVLTVEGCKDVKTAKEMGFTATTNPFGAGKWKNEYSETLKDKNVVVISDNDEPGIKHAETVAQSLWGKAKSIKLIRFTDMPKGADLTDFANQYQDKTEAAERLSVLIDRAPEWEPPKVKIEVSANVHDLSFPEITGGVAKEFADAYGEITEAPWHFYLMAYLVCLGSALAGIINLKTLLKVQSRLYVIFLGVSGRGRKSTPISIATEFFKSILPEFGLMHHANSGEGLGVFMEKSPSTLLVYDELMGFVSKANQKGNTLLGTVTSLFEKNEYQTATKDKQLLIENAYLSMLAACTTDTWERCWNPDFTAIGLVNRLFLVPGNMEKLVPIPPQLNLNQWRTLRENTLAIIRFAREVREYDLTPEAKSLYDHWYCHELDHKSLHSVRLDAHALRLMLLLAVSRGAAEIDASVAADAIRLVTWQHKVRQLYDPLDADNEMARVETRIRRALSTGEKTRRELQQHTNAQRSGLWIWRSALENLRLNEEVFYNPSSKKYMAAETL
jgi:5S rRNA maturation endonuclease (ribonuclease M5)